MAPWTVALPDSSVHGILQQFPSPQDLPTPGIKPRSPELQADSLLSEPPGKPVQKVKGPVKTSMNFNLMLKD